VYRATVTHAKIYRRRTPRDDGQPFEYVSATFTLNDEPHVGRVIHKNLVPYASDGTPLPTFTAELGALGVQPTRTPSASDLDYVLSGIAARITGRSACVQVGRVDDVHGGLGGGNVIRRVLPDTAAASGVIRITSRTELIELARVLGVRSDWHEPDEQDLGATVGGVSFDNAGFWPPRGDASDPPPEAGELHVVLWRTEVIAGITYHVEPLAAVNLATLFSWATGHDDPGTSVIDVLRRERDDWRRRARRAADREDQLREVLDYAESGAGHTLSWATTVREVLRGDDEAGGYAQRTSARVADAVDVAFRRAAERWHASARELAGDGTFANPAVAAVAGLIAGILHEERSRYRAEQI